MIDHRQSALVKRLANEGLKTLDFFRALSPEERSQPVYVAGSGWTPHDILCHLLSAEQGFHHLISDILLGGPGAPEDMDIDAFNEQQVRGMAGADFATALQALSQARVTTLEIVRTLRPGDLDRQGRHPLLGIVTLEQMLKLIYRHAMIHQRDIRRAIQQGSPVDARPAPTPAADRRAPGSGQASPG